jgi:diaminopimelate decarboxylase
MEPYHYVNGTLHCEQVSLKQLAKEAGTPLFVYSRRAIEENYRKFDQAFSEIPHLVCFAVKSNANLTVLRLFRELGAGFDIASGGELFRTRQVGADPQRIVFSGVGKTNSEIDYALNTNLLAFNVESLAELEAIEARGKFLNRTARVSFRVNPDIDAETHPYIATGLQEHKFGISIEEVVKFYQYAATLEHVEIIGISCHIGSQITVISPFLEAAQRIFKVVEQLAQAGIHLKLINFGGGLGIRYHNETPPAVEELARGLAPYFYRKDFTLILEPGRVLSADPGVLLTETLYVKKNNQRFFVIVDAGMTELIRPALYKAYHEIWPVEQRAKETFTADVVGPVCETSDFLACARELQVTQRGDLLAVMNAGAYGFAMSSNYNSRLRPAEVLVQNSSHQIVRKRETFEDLVRNEKFGFTQ